MQVTHTTLDNTPTCKLFAGGRPNIEFLLQIRLPLDTHTPIHVLHSCTVRRLNNRECVL